MRFVISVCHGGLKKGQAPDWQSRRSRKHPLFPTRLLNLISTTWPFLQRLDIFHDAGAVGEVVGIDSESLEHGDEQVREGLVFAFGFVLPGFAVAEPGTALEIHAGVVDVLAVPEAHVLSAGEDERIVAREMKGARGGSE